jgi:polyisoprenoid-binding protein YceI
MNKLYGMRPNYPFLLLGLCIAALARPVAAQQTNLELSPTLTKISFSEGEGMHAVRGTFKLKQGAIRVDGATGHAEGSVTADAASGNSGNHLRDSKMAKDVLDSGQYPAITFTPTQVQGQVLTDGEFKIQVTGNLVLHGSSHALTLDVVARVAGKQLIADTHFRVPYVSWGMKNPGNLVLRVSDTVDISIHAVGRLTLPSAPGASEGKPPGEASGKPPGGQP